MLYLVRLSSHQLLPDFNPFMLEAVRTSSFLPRQMGLTIRWLEPKLSHSMLLIKRMKYPGLQPGWQVMPPKSVALIAELLGPEPVQGLHSKQRLRLQPVVTQHPFI